MESITLTMNEQRVATVLQQLIDGKATNKDAARVLGLSVRQVQRKKKRYLAFGISSVPHKSRGKPTSRGYSLEFKENIVDIYKKDYLGWNFSHFRDTLEDDHDIIVSRSFIHLLLSGAGYKSPKRKKHKPKGHPPRNRRENAGELVQIDASDHAWIELSGEKHHLHGAIDDATGTVLSCVLQKEETAYGYQLMLKEIIEGYGFPECLYTDFRTVFQSNKKLSIEEELSGKEIGATRYARMLEHLGIDIISTMIPQAKGRIERLWETFQDRLVKELTKNHITSLEEANRYIKDVFLPRYNARFASTIDYSKNHFIKAPADFDYNAELALIEHHRVCHSTYLQSSSKTYAIMLNGKPTSIRTSEVVDVYTRLDGSKWMLYNDQWYSLVEIHRVKVPKMQKPRLSPEELSARRSQIAKQTNTPWRQSNSYLFRNKA